MTQNVFEQGATRPSLWVCDSNFLFMSEAGIGNLWQAPTEEEKLETKRRLKFVGFGYDKRHVVGFLEGRRRNCVPSIGRVMA